MPQNITSLILTFSAVRESRRVETAVEILNLIPGTIFHICVFSVSAANFQTPSAILHVRTKSLPLSQTQQNATVGGPTIRASVPRSTAGLAAPSAPLMSREHSGSQLQAKRTPGSRKLSPAANGTNDTSHNHAADTQKGTPSDESDENQQQLAERLKSLKHENEALDKQAGEEEEEHIALLKELEKQRDDLKRRVKEKDEASGDLKRQVYKLETVNRTVQSERSKRERLLHQKEAEHKKRKNDMARWQEQASRLNKNIEQAKADQARVQEEAQKRKDHIREKIAKEHVEMKSIDDEIQDKGGRIKKLEEERKKLQGGDSEDGNNELDRIDNERARQWDARLGSLQTRYASLVSLHAQVQHQYQEAQEQVRYLVSRFSSASGPFSLPMADLDLSNTGTIRPRRHRNSFASNVSSPVNFPGVESSFQPAVNYNSASTASPTFASNPAFFNINNGMVMPDLTEQAETVRVEPDPSLNNPQMSPRAGALLPSDLLGDEESPEMPGPMSHVQFPNAEPSSAALENFPHVPPSPGSAASQPTSLLGSPREKSLHRDSDSQSGGVGTVEDDAPKSASRKLVDLFGLSRPRGKTLADEPPLLGTLKPGQSHSFPRKLEEIEPIGSKRRRSSFTDRANPMSSLLPKSSTANATTDSSSDHLHSRRAALYSLFSSGKLGHGGLKPDESVGSSTGYNQFSPRHDPIDPSYILGTARRGSLTGGSMLSESQLPHPSTDNQLFGWSPAERWPSAERSGHRSPLGFDWTASRWPSAPSPRPSTQYSSTGHLPLGLTGEPDFVVQGLADKPTKPTRPLQAPIGTRPSSSHQMAMPKLNPAAPSFETVVDRDSDNKKDENEDENEEDEADIYLDDDDANSSPKESQSIDEDNDEQPQKLKRTTSEDSTEEGLNSKGSLISKFTRKGSSGKFSSWKDRPGLFVKKKGEQQQQQQQSSSLLNESEGENNGEQLGKSLDGSTASGASGASSSIGDKTRRASLNFFGRKAKKSSATDKVEAAASETSEQLSEVGDDEGSEV